MKKDKERMKKIKEGKLEKTSEWMRKKKKSMKKRQHSKVRKDTTIKSHISDKQNLKELNLRHCRPGKLFVLSNNPKSEKPSLLLPTPFITSGCCS